MNLWHDVSKGENFPEVFNCIIETPKGSQNKYEIHKETGLIALDRANYSSAGYPFEYGFIPQTLWDDGDAIDVILLTTFPLGQVGVMVEARPVALMEMMDSGESDYKIICVPTSDKRFEDTQDLADLNKHNLKEFKHFFETLKMLKSDDPNKYKVEVLGYKGKAEAMEAMKRSVELYNQKFAK